MRQAQKFFTLPASEQRHVVHTAMLLVAFRLGLWLVPYRYLKRLVERVARRGPEGSQDELDRVVRNVVSIAQFIPSASCLTQALATQVLLRQDGFDPKLQIGVARDEAGTFKAHAWVECAGRIVVGDFTGVLPYVAMENVAEKVA